MDVIAIAAGPHHVVAVGSESEVFSWGRGEAGRLGLGNEEDWCVSLSVYRFYFISEHITEVSSCVLCVSGVFFFFFFFLRDIIGKSDTMSSRRVRKYHPLDTIWDCLCMSLNGYAIFVAVL